MAEEFITREGLLKSLHLDIELARLDFETMVRPLVQSTLECVDRALQDAGLRPAICGRCCLSAVRHGFRWCDAC